MSALRKIDDSLSEADLQQFTTAELEARLADLATERERYPRPLRPGDGVAVALIATDRSRVRRVLEARGVR